MMGASAEYEEWQAEEVEWGATMRLALTVCRGPKLPADQLISSVRGVVVQRDKVLMVQNAAGERHIIPGGRREPGEDYLTTLRREIGEETGCVLLQPQLLGWLRFRHLTPRPTNYRYPYPEFVQLIYVATSHGLDHRLRLAQDFERSAEFIPLHVLDPQMLRPSEQRLLAWVQTWGYFLAQ